MIKGSDCSDLTTIEADTNHVYSPRTIDSNTLQDPLSLSSSPTHQLKGLFKLDKRVEASFTSTSILNKQAEKIEENYCEQVINLLPSNMLEGHKRHILAAFKAELADVMKLYKLDETTAKQLLVISTQYNKQKKHLRQQYRELIHQHLKKSFSLTLLEILEDKEELRKVFFELVAEENILLFQNRKNSNAYKTIHKKIKKYKKILEQLERLEQLKKQSLHPLEKTHSSEAVLSPARRIRKLRFAEEVQCKHYSGPQGAFLDEFTLPLQTSLLALDTLAPEAAAARRKIAHKSFISKNREQYRMIVHAQMAEHHRKFDEEDRQAFMDLQAKWQNSSSFEDKQSIIKNFIDYFEKLRDITSQEFEETRFYIGKSFHTYQDMFQSKRRLPPGHAHLTEERIEQLLAGQPILVERTYLDMQGKSYTEIEFFTQDTLLVKTLPPLASYKDLEEGLKVALAKAHAPLLSSSNSDPLADAFDFLRATGKYQHRISIKAELISDEEFRKLVEQRAESIRVVNQQLICLAPKIILFLTASHL